METPCFSFESDSVDLSNVEALKAETISMRNVIKSLKDEKIDLSLIRVTNLQTKEVMTLQDMDKVFNN